MILVKNLTKIYYKKNKVLCKALDDINLVLSDKGFVFIVGKSGSGKSTMLNMLSGMDNFTSGTIIADGNDFSKMTLDDFATYRSKYVSFIFQDYHLIDGFTVEDNIRLTLDISGEKADVSEMLKNVGIKGYENKFPRELSGGERQRAAIARALIKQPSVIFADEPTGNLDAQTTKAILKLLKKISKEKLVVIVSHNLRDADKYGDRIIELSDGKVVSDRSRSKSYKNELEINKGVLKLPHHYDLEREDIEQILVNKENIKSVIQNGDGLKETKEIVYEEKKVDFVNKHISRKNISRLFSIFFKRKFFSKCLRGFLCAVLVSLIFVLQSLGNFNSDRSALHDIIGENRQTVVLKKNYTTQNHTIQQYVNVISDDEYETINDLYSSNVYKFYNDTIGVQGSTSIEVGNYPEMANFDSAFPSETRGVLNCDETFMKKILMTNEIEVLAGNLYEPSYGIIITDYFADILISSNPFKYRNGYEDVIGAHYQGTLRVGYISAVVKTDYKEKYKDFILQVKQNGADNINMEEVDDFENYVFDIYQRLAIGYNLSPNYQTEKNNIENRNRIILSKVRIDGTVGDEDIAGLYIMPDENKLYSLKDNEIVMPVEIYNEFFNTSYTEDNMDEFTGDTLIVTKYTDGLKKEKYKQYEFNVVGLTTVNTVHCFVSDEFFLNAYDANSFCYALYFDNPKLVEEEIMDFAIDNNYTVENNAFGIYIITRAVMVFEVFINIIMYALIIALMVFLISTGIKIIKDDIYEIGILKALGANFFDISLLFMLQIIVLAVGICGVSLVGIVIASKITDALLVESIKVILGETIKNLTIIQLYPFYIWLDILASFVIVVLSSIYPLIHLRKLKPINILRAKE